MIRIFTCFLSLCLVINLTAQIKFSQASPKYTEDFFSGVAVMVTDVNGDGLDDIVRMQKGNLLTVTLQGQEERFLDSYSYQMNGGEQWNITGGDLQNDGGWDILTSGVYDRVKVFRATPFSHEYSFETIQDNTFFGQACNIVDINNDGYLDHFVCHDDGKSIIFMNDSLGNLVRNNDVIDFTTTPPSDNSGNYGSIWTDIDSDGDIDLHIAKCRGGVNNPEDPRRINALYLNNGDGTYSEKADSFNLAIGAQSWTADFGDFDNDGDFDAFITNHNVAGQLLENIDNAYFEDITLNSGVSVFGLSMQGTFRDFDNDGLLDLIVSGTQNYLYRNIGNRQFEAVESPFSERMITSYGIGDLNNDGFLDLYATYNDLYNDPSNIREDVIWLNDGNAKNNHLRVLLTGTVSNRSAVGARLSLYTSESTQTREVHAGEGYGITNSLTQHFGLGELENIDSLVINWPSGAREVYSEIEINKTLLLEEGGCQSYLLDLVNDGPFVQCDSTEYVIVGPKGYTSYLWSNGSTEQEIQVKEPGVYHVSLTDDKGCIWIAGPVLISPESDVDPTELTIDVDGNYTTCSSELVELFAPEGALAYSWSTGETTQSIIAWQTGEYSLEATFYCKSLDSDTVSITKINPNEFEIVGDTLYEPGSAELMAIGDSILWYDIPGGDPVGSGSIFQTGELDTTTAFYAQQVLEIPGAMHTVGQTMHTGGTLYNSNQSNGALRFNVLSRLRLDSVLVMTDFEGARTVLIMDTFGDTIYSQTFQIDSGSTYLPIELWLDEGEDFLITTDRDSNQVVFGGNSPRLQRSDGGFLYPFVVDQVIELTGTATSQQFYYYFYDWHLTLEDQYCIGEYRQTKVVVLDTTSSVLSIKPESLGLKPNPVTDELLMEPFDVMENAHAVMLFNSAGQAVSDWHYDMKSGTADVSQLPQGVYTIRVESPGRVHVGRFIKM